MESNKPLNYYGQPVHSKSQEETRKNNISCNNASTNTSHNVSSQDISTSTTPVNADVKLDNPEGGPSENCTTEPHPKPAVNLRNSLQRASLATFSQQYHQRQRYLRKNLTFRHKPSDINCKYFQNHVKMFNAPLKSSYISPYCQYNFNSHNPASKTSIQMEKSTTTCLPPDPEKATHLEQSESNSENINKVRKNDFAANAPEDMRDSATTTTIVYPTCASVQPSLSLPSSFTTCTIAPPSLLTRCKVSPHDLRQNTPELQSPAAKPSSIKQSETGKYTTTNSNIIHRRKCKYLSPRSRRTPQLYALLKKKTFEDKYRTKQLLSSPNNLRPSHSQSKSRSSDGYLTLVDRSSDSRLPPSGRARQTRSSIHRKGIAHQRRNAENSAKPVRLLNKPSPKVGHASSINIHKYPRSERPNVFRKKHSSATAPIKVETKSVPRQLLYKTQCFYTSRNLPETSYNQTRPKSKPGTNEKPYVRSRSVGDPKMPRFQKGCHNVRKTALLLKFQTERWRIKTGSGGSIDYELSSPYIKDNQDCFAAWELTQHEVMQSCKSEDLLIMKNNLQQSSPHSYKRTTIPYKCKYIMITHSDDSLSESKNWLQRQETRYGFVTCGNLQSSVNSKSDPHMVEGKTSKTHSVYTTTNDTTPSSSRWSITSTGCTHAAAKKGNRTHADKRSRYQFYTKRKNLENKHHAKKQPEKYNHQTAKQKEKDIAERGNQGATVNGPPKENPSIKSRFGDKIKNLAFRKLKTSMGFCEKNKLPAERASSCLQPPKPMQKFSRSPEECRQTSTTGLNTQSINKRTPVLRAHFGNTISQKYSEIFKDGKSEISSSLIETVYHIDKAAATSIRVPKEISKFNTERPAGTVTKYCAKYAISKSSKAMAKSIRKESRKDAADARRSSQAFQPSRKTSMCVWKWRLLCSVFLILLAICHYIAFLATAATM